MCCFITIVLHGLTTLMEYCFYRTQWNYLIWMRYKKRNAISLAITDVQLAKCQNQRNGKGESVLSAILPSHGDN